MEKLTKEKKEELLKLLKNVEERAQFNVEDLEDLTNIDDTEEVTDTLCSIAIRLDSMLYDIKNAVYEVRKYYN